jgi:hypothetical protein
MREPKTPFVSLIAFAATSLFASAVLAGDYVPFVSSGLVAKLRIDQRIHPKLGISTDDQGAGTELRIVRGDHTIVIRSFVAEDSWISWPDKPYYALEIETDGDVVQLCYVHSQMDTVSPDNVVRIKTWDHGEEIMAPPEVFNSVVRGKAANLSSRVVVNSSKLNSDTDMVFRGYLFPIPRRSGTIDMEIAGIPVQLNYGVLSGTKTGRDSQTTYYHVELDSLTVDKCKIQFEANERPNVIDVNCSSALRS